MSSSIKKKLILECGDELAKITGLIQSSLKLFHREGIIVGLSGGIDSAVTASICVKAIGPDRVFALFMPESESSPDSLSFASELAAKLGIKSRTEDLTGPLQALDTYQRRNNALALSLKSTRTCPKFRIETSKSYESSIRIYYAVIENENGEQERIRLSKESLLGVVAASNFKQRCRKIMEYYYADKMNYLVAGTPNALEHDLGFFVKCGDGSADIKPIAHLYKSQVYQMARYLDIPKKILERTPTTDTYPLEQHQDDFYFSVNLFDMDVCLYAHNNNISAADVAAELNLSNDQVKRIFNDIEAKKRLAKYLSSTSLMASNSPFSIGRTPISDPSDQHSLEQI